MDKLPDTCCQSTTCKRTYDEDPELTQSLATLEESGTDRTGGVHRSTCEVNAYQMDEDE